jgi:alkylhydroperoxidase family enzyme
VLAHGKVLRDQFYDAGTVRRIVTDHRQAGLDPVDVAIMDFASKVTADAASVTAVDVAALRARGLPDSDILDVTLAAAARCFFSTVLEAMGTEPDTAYRTDLEPELHQALAVGRPIPATDVAGGQQAASG